MSENVGSRLLQVLDVLKENQDVSAIGLCGDMHRLENLDGSDIDIFVFCRKVPVEQGRMELYNRAALHEKLACTVFDNADWGIGDYASLCNTDTWFMYFTLEAMVSEIERTLSAGNLAKRGYFYPIGRCATLMEMTVLHDKDGALQALKDRVSDYPDTLARSSFEYHLDNLEDTEDLERAVRRKDVLFYHFALDLALDHFLQAAFAINKTYFPSRKRSLEKLTGFELKPQDCSARLLHIVKWGACPDTLAQSFESWLELVQDLKKLDWQT